MRLCGVPGVTGSGNARGKCSATNRLIPAKEHGAVQLNVAQVMGEMLNQCESVLFLEKGESLHFEAQYQTLVVSLS